MRTLYRENDKKPKIIFGLKERLKYFLPCKKKDPMIEKGIEKLRHELDIVSFLQSIQKLKAGLAAVVADDKKLMAKT